MVDDVRNLELALGDGIKRVEENEAGTAVVQRRGLYIARDLEKGNVLTANDLVALRPFAEGMFPPYAEQQLVGQVVNRSLNCGEALMSDFLVEQGS